MLSQNNHLTSELVQEEPTVVILLEKKSELANNLLDFFQKQAIPTELFLISDFRDDSKALAIYDQLKKTSIYKLLYLGGWQKDYLENQRETITVLEAINQGLASSGQILPIFFLLNYSTPLSFLALDQKELSAFWQEQQGFLSTLLKTFPLANYCLLEDFISQDAFSPRFNLLFLGFRQAILIDCEQEFYWQDYQGLMENFARLFFQSQSAAKYILRGKKTAAETCLNIIAQSCSQYFRKDFKIHQLLTEQDKPATFLANFVTLYGKGGTTEKTLDEQIRLLPHSLMIDGGINTGALSNSEPTKATSMDKDERLPTITKQRTKQPAKTVASIPNTSVQKNEAPSPTSSTSLESKLKTIFKNQHQEHQAERFEKNLQTAKSIVKKTRHRKAFFYIGLFIFSLGGLLILLFANFFFSQVYLKNQIFKNIQAQSAQKITQEHTLNKGLIYQSFSWQLAKYQQLLGADQFSSSKQYWDLYNHLAEVKNLNEELIEMRLLLFQEVFQSRAAVDPAFDQYLTLETRLYEGRRLLNQSVDALNLDNFSPERATLLRELAQSNLKKLKTQQRTLTLLRPLIEIVAGPARSNIAILVQDNSELRSSGGFLSSLVLLSFESGRLINWQSHGVGDLDKRVYGDRQASPEMKSLLASDRLFLRDANWPADFVEAANDITWFIEQSLSVKPDLMLSINTQDLQKILAEWGTITLANSSVDANNFYDFISRDEQALDAFLNAFFERLLSSNAGELDFFSQYLIRALEGKESYLFSTNKNIQTLLQNNLWAGEILDTPCPSEFANAGDECFLDGVFQVENNIGLNKSNRLLVEKIEHSIGISENFIRHKRKINLQNLSRQTLATEGDYQSYFKFYLPRTARLEKILLINALGQEKAYGASEYILKEVGEKLELGLRLTLPKAQSLTLEVTYVLAHQLQSPFSYVFLEQKQAGLFNKSIQYQVLFEEDLKPQLIAPQADYENKVISFDNNNQDNFIFAVAFSRDSE